jgi:hypothetical protein
MVPLNDSAHLGVDWTLTCGGNAQIGYVTTGCGSLLPAHTANGVPATYTAPGAIPADNTITITARVTSDPSQASSATIAIANPPVAVVMGTSPVSLAVGATASLSAVVTNDITTQGVTWSATCGAGSCGTFSTTKTLSGVSTTYTAPSTVPAGGSVTITATSLADPTKSALVSIAILPITVSVSPTSFYIGISGTASLTALVVNDVKGAGVTWSCGPPGCGSFSLTKTGSGTATTYTAPTTVPAGNTVTITATSVSATAVSASSVATVTASPVITVKITTSPSSLAEGAAATLRATVTGDSTNAGVDWTMSCGSSAAGACGTLSTQHTASAASTIYTAPSAIPPSNPVTIVATSDAYNHNPSLGANPGTALITITAPPAITFTQQPPSSIPTGGGGTVIATVANDTTQGGVVWTVQCSNTTPGACGYVQPYKTADGAPATYFAPPVLPGVPVEIRAASAANPTSLFVLSSPVTVIQSTVHSIAFVPYAPSQLEIGTTVGLNAAVTNDSTNAGVDWTVCGSGCGFFTTRPAQAAIPAVPPGPGDPGSPYIPAVPAVTATSVQGWPNGLPIQYTAPDVIPDGGVVMTASAATDRLNGATSPAAAVSTIAITSAATGPAIHGVVLAGTQAVAGAAVYLYAAGTSGYASASIPISSPNAATSIQSGTDGSFTIPAGYACPQPNSQLYLVATGGGVGSGVSNPNLALMTALGPCNNISSTQVVINEVTTVASAAALQSFSADNIQTGKKSYLAIGSSSANATVGLANAFASVTNLIDVTTGRAKYFSVAGNAIAPYVQINTLADALDACAVTTGGTAGDGSVCGNLFTDTNPLNGSDPYFAPTDTLQAIIDLLRPPSPSIVNALPGPVFGLATLSSLPFQPILSSAPNEWSLSLNYTSGGGVGGSGATASGSSALAVDASGNVWITNKNINSVSAWSNLGAAYSPNTSGTNPGGFTAGGVYAPAAVAVDPSGYIWTVNGNGTLTKLDSLGDAYLGSPYAGGGLASTGADMAIDGSGNVWATSGGTPGSVSKFNNRGIPQSPSTGYTSGIADPSAIAIDGADNIWLYNQKTSGNSVLGYAKLNNANGSVTIAVPGGFSNPQQLAIDGSGDVWASDGSGTEVLEIPAGYTGAPNPQPTDYPSVGLYQPIAGAKGIAFDGSNRLWIANSGGFASNGSNIVAPNLGLFDTITDSVSIDYENQNFAAGADSVAVDASGNVWVLLGNNTVTEYIGLAAPVVTPLSVGVKNGKLGAKP